MVDINLEKYFQEDFSGWDKIERVVLDPNKRTHGETFNEHADQTLDHVPLESSFQDISISTVTHEDLEKID